MTWLTQEQIKAMGFAEVGMDVFLSDKASYYNCASIRIGSHVRIDDFCVLSAGTGGIILGDYIHIAVYSSLIGAGEITLADYTNISSRVAIYSSNDDYSGRHMTSPMVPQALTGVTSAKVRLGKHVIIGTGSVILPGVVIGEGVAVGALSLVKAECDPFGVYGGVPARRLSERKTDLLQLEQRLRA
jgi:galactoside O-acetyltransferase